MINIILVRSLHFGSLGFAEKDVHVVHRHANIYILLNLQIKLKKKTTNDPP